MFKPLLLGLDAEILQQDGELALGNRLTFGPLRPWAVLHRAQMRYKIVRVDLAEVELLENRLDVGQQNDTNRLFAHRRDRRCSRGPDPLRPLATRRIGNSKKRSPVIGGTAVKVSGTPGSEAFNDIELSMIQRAA